MKTKHIIIVTGLSGAGKTTALNILEDMNYYTIDNLPLGLEKSLLDTEIEKLAVGIDIRTFKNTKDFFKFINYIKETGVKMDIIFIEAHEAIILGRYTLTRRAHPLKEVTLLRSILKEKKILFPIREIADLVIDTTDTKILLGAQVAGKRGAALRADALAVAIQNKMTVQELANMDFLYAPPFSTTWDIMNVAANVAK